MTNSFWEDDAYEIPKASSNNVKTSKSNSFWDDDSYELPKNNQVNKQKQVVQKPIATVQKPKPIQNAQPLTGGVSKNYAQNWDNKGRIYYTDENGNKVKPENSLNPLEKFGRNVQAKLTNIDAAINRPSAEQQKAKEEVAKFLGLMGATAVFPNPLNPAIGALAKTAAKPIATVAGKVGSQVAKKAIKAIGNSAIRAGAGATRGAIDSVPWSLGEYGIEKALGYNSEETLPQKIAHNAKDFAMFTGLAAPAIQAIKVGSKTPIAQEAIRNVRNQLDAHPAIADAVVGAKNFFTPEAKFQNQNDALAKLEKVNEVKNKKPDFTNEQLAELKRTEEIPIDDFGAMHRELTEGGAELEKVKQELAGNPERFENLQDEFLAPEDAINKDSIDMFGRPFLELTPEEQDVFAKALEEKFNPKLEAPESNLSHVEQPVDVTLPKEEPTAVKNDSRMANDVKQEITIPEGYYKDDFGNIVKSNPSKIQRFNKEELAKQQNNINSNESRIGIKSKEEIKNEINNEQKYEFIPEEPNKPMEGSVPQPEIKPEINKPKNMFSQREKNEIRRKAEQHRKETNNFKFPEETENYKVTKLESGTAEGADTSWNTHAVQDKKNYGEDYDLSYSQKQYKNNYKNGTEEVNSIETAKKSRFIKDDADFQKFYDRYSKASEEEKQVLLNNKLKKIKQTKNAKAAEEFYEDIMNQVERDKLRYENGLSDVKVSDLDEAENVAKAFKENKVDVNTMYDEELGKQGNKRTSVKNKVFDLINDAIEKEDAPKLQSLLQNHKSFLNKQDTNTIKLRDKAYSKAAELSRKEMQSYLDKGDFEGFYKAAKRTESIRKNDKTLHSLKESKQWSNKEEQIFDEKGNLIAQGQARGKVGTGQTFDSELGLHRDLGSLKDRYTSWEQEKKYWEQKVKEAKELPNKIQEYINRTGVDYDTAKTIVKSNNKFKEKFKNIKETIKNKLSKEENLTDFEEAVNEHITARENAENIKTGKELSELDKDIAKIVEENNLQDIEAVIVDNSKTPTFKSNGRSTEGIDAVLINGGKRTLKERLKSIIHEFKHVADNNVLKKLQEDHPVKQFLTRYEAEKYEPARKYFNSQKAKEVKEVYNSLTNDIIDKLWKFDKSGIPEFVKPDEFNKIIDSLPNSKYIDTDLLKEYNLNGWNYTRFPREKRAFDAMKGIHDNESITESLDRFFTEEYGKEYESVKRATTKQRSVRNVEANGEQMGTSPKGQTTTKLGKEEIKGENIILEKDNKGLSGFHYSPDGTFDQLAFDLNKSKSLFKTEGQKQTFKTLVKYSTQDEKTLIDLGIITPEQAKNRLIKQHYKGEGVYIPTTYKPSKGKIDLEKDYNAGRRTKKGLFGEKKEYGVDREVDVKETVKKTIQRHIDIEHVKNVSKVVEDTFAEHIINGEIKKGYIGVNKNLLNTMMYGKYSKDWYKTIASGEDAISKAFKDKEVKEGWLDLFSRSSDKNLNIKYDYQIPESVFNKLVDGTGEKAAEYWERYAGQSFANKLKGVGHWTGAITDALMNNFKKRVLTSSSFFVNNRIGNQIMIAMNSENPIEYLKSYKGLFKYKNSDVPTEIIQNSLLEAVENSTIRHRYTGNNAIDNALNLFNGSLIETKNLKGMKKLGAKAANAVIGLPNKAFNKLSEKLMKFNQLAEDAERRQIFSQIVDKSKRDLIKKTGQNMVKEEEILKHINSDSEIHALVVKEIEDTLGDYKNFSPLEQKTLKRIVPFYSWYRTITRHTVKLMKEHPERAGLLALELKHFNELGEDNGIKEYQRYGIPLKLKEDRTGKNLVVNKGHSIPYMTFKEFFDEGGKGSISPLLKIPAEAIRGKKYFLDQEISNGRYIRTGYKWNKDDKKYDEAYYDTKKQDWVRDKEGNVKLDKDYKLGSLPISTRLGYVGKELLTDTVAPYLNNSLINGEKLITTANKFRKTGKFEIPDRIYDASFGGYNHEDLVGFDSRKNKPITRYVGNRLSPKYQALNALLGLSLQNKAEMNQKELEKLEEKREEIRARKAKFQKKKVKQ